MAIYIMVLAMIVMWIALVATYGVGAIHKGQYILGIKLPIGEQDNIEVQEIIRQYRSKYRLVSVVGLCTIPMCFLMIEFTSLVIVYMYAWFLVLLIVHNTLLKKHAWKLYEWKKRHGKLELTLAQKEAGVEDDSDLYWLTGKKDPNKKGLQDKRIGYGMEYSMGKKGTILIVTAFSVLVLGIAAFMLKFDLATVSMERQGNQVFVEAADMKETFAITDIKEVSLLEKYPSMSKNNGYNGTNFNFGTFRVSGVGTCEVYLNLKNDIAIQVVTNQETILFNMKTKEETEKAYEQLKGWMEE